MTEFDTDMLLLLGTLDPADQARELGLQVGDTIEGREECGTYWHEARLTLLWLGKAVAVWRVTERGTGSCRTSAPGEWSEPEESADWTLDCRAWKKLPAQP